jgi:hypothetical protein
MAVQCRHLSHIWAFNRSSCPEWFGVAERPTDCTDCEPQMSSLLEVLLFATKVFRTFTSHAQSPSNAGPDVLSQINTELPHAL